MTGPGASALRLVLYASLGALALTGPMGIGLALAALVGSLLPGPRLRPWGWAVAHGAVLVVTAAFALTISAILGFSVLVAWLLVHRTWMGRTGDDARVALLLATLLLLLGAGATDTVGLAAPFGVFGFFLPIALLRAEMTGTGEPAPRALELSLAGASAVLSLALFVALPRLDGGYLSRAQGGGGRFPSDVTLGQEGLVSDDATEVFRATVRQPDGRPAPGPFHFRGRTFDRFDGARWSVSVPLEPPARELAGALSADMRLATGGTDVLFGVGDLLRVEDVSAVRRPGDIFVPIQPGLVREYRILGRENALADIATAGLDPWLQLPDGLDGRITTLAYTVVPADETDPVVIAEAMTRWLGTTYGYVETPPPPEGDPLAWFLFDARAGHCEYFASALAVLLRVRGVPTRLATGFHSGELGDDGAIVVRRGNAHAWIEVRTHAGWATLDATPSSSLPAVDGSGLLTRLDALVAGWYRNVVEYDTETQFAAYGAVGRRLLLATGSSGPQNAFRAGFVGLVAIVGFLGVAFVGTRLWLARFGGPARRRPDVGARLAAAARAAVRKRGWALPEDLPLLEAAEWLEARVGAEAAPLRRLGELVYAARYMGAPLAVSEGRSCVRALRRIPRPRG